MSKIRKPAPIAMAKVKIQPIVPGLAAIASASSSALSIKVLKFMS
jgi:hypothetical protein